MTVLPLKRVATLNQGYICPSCLFHSRSSAFISLPRQCSWISISHRFGSELNPPDKVGTQDVLNALTNLKPQPSGSQDSLPDSLLPKSAKESTQREPDEAKQNGADKKGNKRAVKAGSISRNETTGAIASKETEKPIMPRKVSGRVSTAAGKKKKKIKSKLDPRAGKEKKDIVVRTKPKGRSIARKVKSVKKLVVRKVSSTTPDDESTARKDAMTKHEAKSEAKPPLPLPAMGPNIETVQAKQLQISCWFHIHRLRRHLPIYLALEIVQPPVPNVAHGLERVLFK